APPPPRPPRRTPGTPCPARAGRCRAAGRGPEGGPRARPGRGGRAARSRLTPGAILLQEPAAVLEAAGGQLEGPVELRGVVEVAEDEHAVVAVHVAPVHLLLDLGVGLLGGTHLLGQL